MLLKEETAAVILLRNTRLFKSLLKSVFVPGEEGGGRILEEGRKIISLSCL